MYKQDSGEDRISALPDDIICNILSNLYVEESARTSILSTRWRNMWLLSPITISDESIVKQSCMYCFTQEESSSWIVNAMSHIISTHPGPIPTCHFILPDWHKYQETLVTLLKTLTLKGIRNLQIYLRGFKVPCFVLECDSLVDVLLRGCLMPAQLPAYRDIFPNLRKLTLIEYDMDNKLLVNLLSSRSIIELALVGCYGFRVVIIESDSLQKLYFKGTDDFDHVYDIVIKDVPNLESFKCDGPLSSKVVILNAPKLKVLSRIEMNMSLLQLGNYQFNFNGRRGMRISGEITYMPSLRSLDIAVNSDDGLWVEFVTYFLVCFPCLETLEVYLDGFYCKHYRNYKSMVTANDDAVIVLDGGYDDHVRLISNINCLNHHLKSVRLSSFYGVRAHFDFARFIVANAEVLETLTIVYGHAFEERWMKAQKHYLMQNSASKMLQVEFLKRV